MKCRICKSDNVYDLGVFKPYPDFEFPVYQCFNCGCRFVNRDNSIYDELHSSQHSPYSSKTNLALLLKDYFDKSDTHSIKRELSKVKQFSVVINAVEKGGGSARLLEVGCSKGYLTSYFISKKYDILGIDISSAAIEIARKLFGDHFDLSDSPLIKDRAPYDIIYHVGTIGCVDFPLEMTREHLSLLKPGGKLIFNAPNIDAAKALGQIWINGTPPPDLVTLFDKKFWVGYFNDLADVTVNCEYNTVDVNLKILYNRFRSRGQLKSTSTNLLNANIGQGQNSKTGSLRPLIKKWLGTMIKLVGYIPLIPKYPNDYGLYVVMVKKG